MDLTTVIVHWSGPHSLSQVCHSENANGIYLLVGKRKYERREQIQYCGITEGKFCHHINKKHHKLDSIRSDTLSIWLGQIIYPAEFDRSYLELAESCFDSFWQPNLNVSKMRYYPSRSVCFISQWFTREGQPRLIRPPLMHDLPDVLWWDRERWRTGVLKVGQPHWIVS